jgi:hypothetical protein
LCLRSQCVVCWCVCFNAGVDLHAIPQSTSGSVGRVAQWQRGTCCSWIARPRPSHATHPLAPHDRCLSRTPRVLFSTTSIVAHTFNNSTLNFGHLCAYRQNKPPGHSSSPSSVRPGKMGRKDKGTFGPLLQPITAAATASLPLSLSPPGCDFPLENMCDAIAKQHKLPSDAYF